MKASFRRNEATRSPSGEDLSTDFDHSVSLEVGAEVRESGAGNVPAWKTYVLENCSRPVCSLGSGFWDGTAKEHGC